MVIRYSEIKTIETMPKNPFPSILYVNVANANVLCQTLVSN